MKKLYETLDKVIKKISSCCVVFSATILFLIVILICVDVVMRYVLKHPISGQQELAELATVVVYFGLPFATRIRSHVRVEPITGKFPASVRCFLYAALDFLITAFMVLMTWKVFTQGVALMATPGNATVVLRIPYFYIYFIASVGAAISTLEFLMDGIRYVVEGVQAIGKKDLAKGGEDR